MINNPKVEADFCAALTSAQAQCYLDRYPDLQNAFGANNINSATWHWTAHGCGENRDASCPPDHSWDFRGCTTGSQIVDNSGSNQLAATPSFPYAQCSALGITFDAGNQQWMLVDPWNWGGATSFETYVKFSSFNGWSRVFDFGNGQQSDNVLLANNGNSGVIAFDGKPQFKHSTD